VTDVASRPRDPPGSASRPRGSPGWVIVTVTAGRAVRSGLSWGVAFGFLVAATALGYVSAYPTGSERRRLAAAFGSDHATSALFGPAPGLQTVAGFTAFKTSMTLVVVGAVWGLLAGTRSLRGEEEAGRWELLLAGRTTPGRATALTLAGSAAGVAALWAVTAAVAVLVGRSSRIDLAPGALAFFALALVSGALMFTAVGAVTSQLASTRRRAASYAAVVLGVSYAIRMVADSGLGLDRLRWVSPLGWIEELHALTGSAPWALVPIGVSTVLLAAVATGLAGARDLGAGLVPETSSSAPRLRLLSGTTGLTVRLTRSASVGWVGAVAAAGLLTGLVARGAGQTISDSSVGQILARLGATGSAVDAYLGSVFLVLAVLVAAAAASLVVLARDEEADGRLDHLLARPVSRARWLAGRVVVAAGVLVACGVVGGAATWAGAADQHAAVGFGALMEAGVNVVPPALCILGFGVLVLGTRPRYSPFAAYGLLVWSLLVEVVGGIGGAGPWLSDTSVFHDVAASPGQPPDWATAAILVLVGAAASSAGGMALARRDLVRA